MSDEPVLRQAYNDGVEAAALLFDRLANDMETLADMAAPGAQNQVIIGRMLSFRLHAAAIRKLKRRE